MLKKDWIKEAAQITFLWMYSKRYFLWKNYINQHRSGKDWLPKLWQNIQSLKQRKKFRQSSSKSIQIAALISSQSCLVQSSPSLAVGLWRQHHNDHRCNLGSVKTVDGIDPELQCPDHSLANSAIWRDRAASKASTLWAPCRATPRRPLPITKWGTPWISMSCLAYLSDAMTASCRLLVPSFSAALLIPSFSATCIIPLLLSLLI